MGLNTRWSTREPGLNTSVLGQRLLNIDRTKKRLYLRITGGEEGLLVAPAGSGKTVIGLSLIPLLGQPTLWLTHTRALALQAIARISEFLPGLAPSDVGFLGDSKWVRGNVIDVALIPTLVRRGEELIKLSDAYGLVVLDEAHHCPATTFTKVVSFLNPYYLYGLTATPYRRDKLEKLMFQTMGPELVRITVEEVEKSGGIVLPVVKYRSIRSATVYGNDIQKIIKTKIIGSQERTNIIVGDVLREPTGGNTGREVERASHDRGLDPIVAQNASIDSEAPRLGNRFLAAERRQNVALGVRPRCDTQVVVWEWHGNVSIAGLLS